MSGIDPNQFALRIGMDLFKARQPLAAAIVYAEIASTGLSAPELWCGLIASLMGCRGRIVRKPFEIWAAKVFRRGELSLKGTPYDDVVKDWLPELTEVLSTAPLQDAEIPTMIAFLLVNEAVLIDAVAALPQDAAMSIVMALGDRKHPIYVPLLRAAVEGKLGDGAARSALKRIGPFLERPDMQASLLTVSNSPLGAELEPYLGFVLKRLPEGWDKPHATVCPPYEGIGKINIELLSAGTDRAAVANVLLERLGASERDSSSWLNHTPCFIKRGAMRDDAMRLESALKPLGAAVKLHGFTYSHEEPPMNTGNGVSAEKKPWWKFW
jgi:hypothetical protein